MCKRLCKFCPQDPDLADPESPTMISEFIIFNREREIERKDREEREAAWEKELLQVGCLLFLCHNFPFSSLPLSATQNLLSSLWTLRSLAATFARSLHVYNNILAHSFMLLLWIGREGNLEKERERTAHQMPALFHLRFAITTRGSQRKLSIAMPRIRIYSLRPPSSVTQDSGHYTEGTFAHHPLWLCVILNVVLCHLMLI